MSPRDEDTPGGRRTIGRPELLVDGSEAPFRALVHDLFGFLARHEAIRNGHGAVIGLPGPQYTALISIAHLQAQDDVSVSALSQHLHVSGAFVTRLVNQLVERGLVDKASDTGDRRRVRLSLTAEGEALLARLAPIQRQVNDVEFGSLTHEDFVALSGIMAKLVRDGDEAVALQKYLKSASDNGRV